MEDSEMLQTLCFDIQAFRHSGERAISVSLWRRVEFGADFVI